MNPEQLPLMAFVVTRITVLLRKNAESTGFVVLTIC